MPSELVVNPAPATIDAGFRKSGTGKPLIVLEGFPQHNEAVTPDRLRDLAECLYQIARSAELANAPAISLRY